MGIVDFDNTMQPQALEMDHIGSTVRKFSDETFRLTPAARLFPSQHFLHTQRVRMVSEALSTWHKRDNVHIDLHDGKSQSEDIRQSNIEGHDHLVHSQSRGKEVL
jgi:hypothetical protein